MGWIITETQSNPTRKAEHRGSEETRRENAKPQRRSTRPHWPGNLGGNRTESSIVSGREGRTIEEQEHRVRAQANALSCYDPPHFLPLPYPSSPTPELVSFDLKQVTRHTTKSPVIFPSAMPPECMEKQPLPLNPPSLSPLEDLPSKPERTRPVIPQWSSPSQVVMTRPPSPAMSIYPSFDLSPTIPEIPFTPWDTHR